MRRRALYCLVLVLLSLCVPIRARAEERVRIVVGDVAGEGGERMRRIMVRALSEQNDLYLVSLSHAKKIAADLGVELDADGVKTVSKALGVAAFLEGTLKPKGNGVTLSLRVRTGADGEVSETQDFSAPTERELRNELRKRVVSEVAPALSEAKRAGSKEKPRVVLLKLTGAKSPEVQEWVEKALSSAPNLSLVPSEQASKLKLTAKSSAAERKAAAATLGAAALIGGEVKVAGRKATLTLSVKNGADGENVDRLSIEGTGLAGLRRAIDADLAKRLSEPLAKTKSPEPPEESVEAEEPETEEAPASSGGARPSPLDFGLELRGFSRRFTYSDDLFNRLRAYKLGLGPAVALFGNWYPLAHFQGGPGANIGITAGYEQSLALKSELSGGQQFTTTMREWFAGLRGRVPMDGYELGISLTYGVHSFVVEDDPIRPLVPDVRYRYLRLGLDGLARVGKVSGGGHLGFRRVSDLGDVASDRWFPHATAGGLDLGIQGGYEVVTRLDLIAGIDYRRYWLSMNSEPGDANVAGGALDQYITGFVGAQYRLPGSP